MRVLGKGVTSQTRFVAYPFILLYVNHPSEIIAGPISPYREAGGFFLPASLDGYQAGTNVALCQCLLGYVRIKVDHSPSSAFHVTAVVMMSPLSIPC